MCVFIVKTLSLVRRTFVILNDPMIFFFFFTRGVVESLVMAGKRKTVLIHFKRFVSAV